jgi:hypothetical protein
MNRGPLSWIVAGAVISALFWVDLLFIPLALLGPLLSGLYFGARGEPFRGLAVMWGVAGMLAVISDFVVNQEDVGSISSSRSS